MPFRYGALLDGALLACCSCGLLVTRAGGGGHHCCWTDDLMMTSGTIHRGDRQPVTVEHRALYYADRQ